MTSRSDNFKELLAPAGNMDCLRAAVESGADAVYLGLSEFSARKFAGNFYLDELDEAVKYAHIRNVKIYLTMNTLILDKEMDDALLLAKKAYLKGIDAFITQDLGFSFRLKNKIPDVELHGSTQMTVFNEHGANFLYQLGFSRVVLARELSLEQIKKVSKESLIETEIFVHGALCVCYSGQCLMSSLIGGRSGNRGKCAQPCRQNYRILEDGKSLYEGNLLSTRDLCLLENLTDVVKSGARSFKIEGRMKSPEYVATVVDVYRRHLDLIKKGGKPSFDLIKEDLTKLKLSYNRGGFTAGHIMGAKDVINTGYQGHQGVRVGRIIKYDKKRRLVLLELETSVFNSDYVCIENDDGFSISYIEVCGQKRDFAKEKECAWIGFAKQHVNVGDYLFKTFDKALRQDALSIVRNGCKRKVPVDINVWVKKDHPLELEVCEGDLSVRVKSDTMPEMAKKTAIDQEKIKQAVSKSGQTVFTVNDVKVFLDSGLFVSVSVVNDLRRKALEVFLIKKEQASSKREVKEVKEVFVAGELKEFKGSKISLYFYRVLEWLSNEVDLERLFKIFDRVGRVYFRIGEIFDEKIDEVVLALNSKGVEVFVSLPLIQEVEPDNRYISRMKKLRIDGVMLSNVSQIKMFCDKGFRLCVDQGINAINTDSLRLLKKNGVECVTSSLELDKSSFKTLFAKKHMDVEVICCGRISVMLTKCCLKNKTGCCEKENFEFEGKGRAKNFVLCDKKTCLTEVFNADKIFLLGELENIKEDFADFTRINITDESIYELESYVEACEDFSNKTKIDLKDFEGYTKGYFSKSKQGKF